MFHSEKFWFAVLVRCIGLMQTVIDLIRFYSACARNMGVDRIFPAGVHYIFPPKVDDLFTHRPQYAGYHP